MKNATHYSLMLIILFFSFFYFSYLGHAAAQNKRKEPSKKQIATSLMQKAKKALLSGNTKLAENYWKQASSIDPTQAKPLWLKNDASNSHFYQKHQNKVLEESKFVQLLHEMPYDKAKIELDKKLLSNPDNAKLRAVYIELAEKNNDLLEANRHRALLGLKPKTKTEPGLKFWLKTLLVIIIIALIIFELATIYKTAKKKNPPLPSNIKSL